MRMLLFFLSSFYNWHVKIFKMRLPLQRISGWHTSRSARQTHSAVEGKNNQRMFFLRLHFLLHCVCFCWGRTKELETAYRREHLFESRRKCNRRWAADICLMLHLETIDMLSTMFRFCDMPENSSQWQNYQVVVMRGVASKAGRDGQTHTQTDGNVRTRA